MAGVGNQEFVGVNGPLNPQHHQQDGLEASVTPEGSAAHAQVTPLDVMPLQQELHRQEDHLVAPQVPQGAPMEVVMVALVNTINCQNELIREQNRCIQAIENSRTTSRISRNTYRRRSPTPEKYRSRSRSRSPRPAPRGNEERPLSLVREHPRRNNRSPPRNNRSSPPRNNRSPPPRNGEAVRRGGNARPPPRRESSGSGDERHREPLSRRTMDIPLPRGLEKPPSLDKYDGTTEPGEHIQSVETALDYRNLRGSIKCKLFPLSLIRGASTWWRSLPPGSIDSWDELYIERFNKEAVEVDATDKMKLYLLEDGLREGTKFQEAVGIVEMATLDEFFELAQRYIKWEEKQKASEVRRPKMDGKVREAKPPKSQFIYYTPLNAPRANYLAEISSAEFKSAGIRHVTEDCVHLKDAIGIFIQKGYARQYVEGQPRTGNNPPRQPQLPIEALSPEQNVQENNIAVGGVALVISRSEDFLPLPNNDEKETLDYLFAHLDGSWENFPGALVISGGGFNPVTIGSIKRKFDELEKASSLTEENLVPYVGSDLQGFNGSTKKRWGYVDLIVTFGEDKAMKSVKVKFLVVDCPSLYNCIFGRPTLAELFAVSSTIHLKLKYYTKNGQVATINGDIEAARRCFEAASKNLNSVVTPKKKKEEAKLPGVNSINTEDAVDLDARTTKKERKQENKAMKDDHLIEEKFRPIPDGELKLVPLGEDPTKGIKIGADLPDLVKRQLKTCLRENAELFACSATEMPGIDPKVACHQLTIDPRASAVVQRRRKQCPEKVEAAEKAVKDLLEANFISEAQYTIWLSNVVLVKKSNGKWRMCVDYTDLRACPKDGATYQRLMNKVFRNEIGDMLEVYMDDMIVNSEEENDHTLHLKKAGKFLGFYLTEREIEANPDKCRAFFEYLTTKSKKYIQTLNGMLTSMARFVAKSAQHALHLFKLLRKETTFEWTEESSEAISAVLIKETEQGQKPVYFVSRALEGPELRYLQIEKIALANDDGVLIEVSLGLSFPMTNNQAEYEACLVGLRLAEEIKIYTDSQLVASQVSGEYQTKEERLLEYLNLIKEKIAKFKETKVKYEMLTKPSIEKAIEVMHIYAIDDQSWTAPVYNFLKSNTLPADAKEATKETRVEFILQEFHEGINGQHIGGRSLERKALRAWYYWPTMQNDAKDHVLKCDKCQRHGDMHIAPASELKTLISLWPFAWWGMDILGPFSTTSRQVKYLIVAVDYFTKWIEEVPLTKLGAFPILCFLKRNMLARSGIPRVVVTDNTVHKQKVPRIPRQNRHHTTPHICRAPLN
ncbi:hypothetical protein TSUD_146160 [Trifolium subterraneum]|uniref:Integrase catalytic domain-containing protein n=1 Tax=Trifolium subterraneum TaxID=3900 RepID=A0A2Z6MZM4_TRISU|nr:hypothetical protein TSUD_146160 [Trifolium subterraneum]